MGGWMWGGTDEDESIRTIHAALEKGIALIDTAPVYGFGHSEEIVGKAIEKWGRRDQVLIATKVGLEWREDVVFRTQARSASTRRSKIRSAV
jgi:aryl-alcohol dehydrogenase-like predicted oxidoreductase